RLLGKALHILWGLRDEAAGGHNERGTGNDDGQRPASAVSYATPLPARHGWPSQAPVGGPRAGPSGKTQPENPADPQRLELAGEPGPLHADECGSTRNIPAETADLGDQVLALEHFAGFAKRQTHELLATVAVGHRRNHGAHVLWQHGRGNDRVGFAARE